MATLQLGSGLTIACSVLFIPACSTVVGLRFYARRHQKAPLDMDDWLMLPALVLVIAMQITMIVEVCYRMIGYPDPNFVPGQPNARSNLAFWPFELEQIPALGLIKLSFLFFYRRIFNTRGTNWLNVTTAAMITIIVGWTIAFFLTFLFICRGHPEDYWISVHTEKSYCVATQKLHVGFSVSDTILDILIMIMAIPMIWGLHMSVSRKFAVTGIFSLGLITVAASVTRMVIFLQATALRYDAYLDFEYLITTGIYWSMLEVGLGLITANLIIVYGLVAGGAIQKLLRSIRSLIPSTFSGTADKERRSSQHSDERRMWAGSSHKLSSHAEFADQEQRLENGILDGHGIHMAEIRRMTEENVK